MVLLLILGIALLAACNSSPSATPQQASPISTATSLPGATEALPTDTPSSPTPTVPVASQTRTVAPGPSPTPIPEPTALPSPRPTLKPTPAPSPSLYLAWFDSPPDSAHSSARIAIETIWKDDQQLGTTVARFPWVGDGIIEAEQLLLEELATLAEDYPELAGDFAEFPWMSTVNGVGTEAHRGVAAMRLAAAADAELAELLSGYPWLQDGITSIEADALAGIAGLAGQDMDTAELLVSSSGFVNGDTLQHVAKAADNISVILQINSTVGREVVAYSWITDGITRMEARALDGFQGLLSISAQDNSGLIDKLAGYSWVRDGFTAIEIKALDDLQSLLEVAERVDSDLAELLAGYPWVADGITSEDLEALYWFEELLDIARESDIPFVEKVAGFSWIADGVTSAEQEDLHFFWRRLEYAQGSESAFLEKLATYSWIDDGITPGDLDATRLLYDSLEAAGPNNSDLAQKVMDYSWVADSITQDEMAALRIFLNLLKAAGTSDSAVVERVLSYSWVTDGISVPEPDAINRLRDLIITGRAAHSSIADILTSYGWVTDEITTHEIEMLHILWVLMREVDPENFGIVEEIADYSWVSDGVTREDLGKLNELRNSIKTSGPNATVTEISIEGDSDSFVGSLNYPWISDGVTAEELEAARRLKDLLEAAGDVSPEIAAKIRAYPWISDGITNNEMENLGRLLHLFHAAAAVNSGVASILSGYPWVEDGLISVELDALHIFHRLIDTAGAENSTYPEIVASYPWVADGITLPEPDDINVLQDLVRFSGASLLNLTETLVQYPWVADGITPIEKAALRESRDIISTAEPSSSGISDRSAYHWITGCFALVLSEDEERLRELMMTGGEGHSGIIEETLTAPWFVDGIVPKDVELLSRVRKFLEPVGSLDSLMAEKLANYPWTQGGVTNFECAALDHFRALLNDPDSGLPGVPWFDDGIDGEELALLSVLRTTKWRSVHQYEELRDSYHVQSKIISLPLAGDVKLLVFRHSPFPGRDESIELMEQMARVLEDFMGVSFPWNPVVLGTIEPSLLSNEKVKRGVGYMLSNQLAITPREYNVNFRLAVFHEMSHIYWGGHTGAPAWYTEGAAGFLPDYARELLGLEKIKSRRVKLHQVWDDECRVWGAGTISKFLSMRDVDPERYESRGICIYALGEFFLLETYQLFGLRAASAAMRELYLQAEATSWTEPITEEQIYRVYLANAPPGKVQAFQRIYERYHGGTYDGG